MTEARRDPMITASLERQAELAQLSEMVGNAYAMRGELFKKLFDPRRDIDDECGYPKVITRTQYRALWDRDAIAKRVVNVLPLETWQTTPTVYANSKTTEEDEAKNPFDLAWKQVAKDLRGQSWFNQEEGSPVWEYLLRADILSGIGSYGIILLGFDDGKKLFEPVDGIDEQGLAGQHKTSFAMNAAGKLEPVEVESVEAADELAGPEQQRRLLYVRVFDQSLVYVSRVESDPSNRRYGQPVMYNVTFNDPTIQEAEGGTVGLTTQSLDVHWTRVIHVADNLASSEVFGVPRMQTAYNRLYDLMKLYAGSAEMYWRGAFPGLSIESHPQLGGDVTVDKGAMASMMTSYANGLQRYLTLVGMTAKSLAPQVVDPTPQIDTQLSAICILIACPKRVFVGSERGELASSQDDDAWNDRLKNRQTTYVTPRIIVPFVDRLILVGVLPDPGEEGYKIDWPDLSSLSDEQRAKIAQLQTQALGQYAQMGIESIMTRMDYFTRILNISEDDARAIIEAADNQQDEMNTGGSPLLSMVGGITGMTQLLTLFAQGAMGEETLKQLIMLFYQLDETQAESIIAEGLPEPPAPEPQIDPTTGLPIEEPPPGQPPTGETDSEEFPPTDEEA